MSERSDYLERPVNEARLRLLKKLVWVFTAVVFGLVVLMRTPGMRLEGIDMTFLPPVHAVLNTLVTICLVLALLAVRGGKIVLHQRCMTAAFLLSALFLLCYVAYHFTTEEVRHGGEGFDRTLYLMILITHIVLAAVSLPMILLSFAYAWSNDFVSHRRLARKVYPLWLYVAVTGPICYLMLKPYY